jgi:hypothetical protein
MLAYSKFIHRTALTNFLGVYLNDVNQTVSLYKTESGYIHLCINKFVRSESDKPVNFGTLYPCYGLENQDYPQN